MKPMLAAAYDGVMPLRFPVIASPKLDGIRCITTMEGPLTRSLKPIPNVYIREFLRQCPPFLDGEIMVGSRFQHVTSAVMSHGGFPEFEYHIFDMVMSRPYHERLAFTDHYNNNLPKFCRIVPHVTCENQTQLIDYYSQCLANGYEGICFRTPDSPYKHGRSTLREQWLVKWKENVTDEARIVQAWPLYKNTNPAHYNELGYLDRTTHQEGLVAQPKLGAFQVRSLNFKPDFFIGSGFTDAQRISFWEERETLVGKLVTFKYHNYGCLDAPRCPIFLSFRSPLDL